MSSDQDKDPKRSINALKRIRYAWKYCPRGQLRTDALNSLNEVIKHKQDLYFHAYQYAHKPKFKWGQTLGKRK